MARFPFRGGPQGPSTYQLTRWLFLRLLAVVWLIAFVSVWVQIEGLAGSRGILPVVEYLERFHETLGAGAYRVLPTLCWFGTSDLFLHGLCAVGVVLSSLLLIGVAPVTVLFALWAVYLSVTIAGQTFLSFQWDILLLEVGFCSMFLAPWGPRPHLPRDEGPAPTSGLWLLRSLLFKLMFLSGVVKLLSMDDAWWELTALDVHYFTQPIPSWPAWFAHQLPSGVQKLSVAIMFVIELAVPFLIFLGRRPRIVAFWALVSLQVLIEATGNYGFFNLLTAVLCVPLVDDAFLGRLLPRRAHAWLCDPSPGRVASAEAEPLRRRAWISRTRTGLVSALIVISSFTFLQEMVRTAARSGVEGPVGGTLKAVDRVVLSWARPGVLRWVDPFRTINGYGLFRVMTRTRPEIVLEASRDARSWREWEFRWKPGDVGRRPRVVAPHQPRLDWQMWFAALNPARARGWLSNLMRGLLEGHPEVTALLADPPFEDGPPTYVRLAYYDYEFTTREERRETGAWWKRTRKGMLSGALSLRGLSRGLSPGGTVP